MNNRLQSFFNEISRFSYCIFSVHHKIIRKVLLINNPITWYKIIFTLGVIILLSIIYIYSKIILVIIIDSIYKSNHL